MQTDETAIYRDYDSVESKQLPWQLQAWRQSVAEGMRHSDIDRLSTTSLPATSHITSCTFTHTPSCTVLRYAALCSAALCCAVLHCAVLHCVVLCCAMLHCTVLCYAALHCAARCCVVLCCAARCCAVLRCTVLCCAALCSAALCRAVLCYAALCSAALCHVVLCCVALCCTALRCVLLAVVSDSCQLWLLTSTALLSIFTISAIVCWYTYFPVIVHSQLYKPQVPNIAIWQSAISDSNIGCQRSTAIVYTSAAQCSEGVNGPLH